MVWYGNLVLVDWYVVAIFFYGLWTAPLGGAAAALVTQGGERPAGNDQ